MHDGTQYRGGGFRQPGAMSGRVGVVDIMVRPRLPGEGKVMLVILMNMAGNLQGYVS